MPIKRASFKSLRQSKKRHIHNKGIEAEVRTLAKKARVLIEAKDKVKADEALKAYESKLCRAVKTNILKKNNASRHISRLRSQWAKLSAAKSK